MEVMKGGSPKLLRSRTGHIVIPALDQRGRASRPYASTCIALQKLDGGILSFRAIAHDHVFVALGRRLWSGCSDYLRRRNIISTALPRSTSTTVEDYRMWMDSMNDTFSSMLARRA